MTQMNIGAARVETHLEAELLAALHKTDELFFGDNLADAACYHGFKVFWSYLSGVGHPMGSGPGLDGSRPHPVLSV